MHGMRSVTTRGVVTLPVLHASPFLRGAEEEQRQSSARCVAAIDALENHHDARLRIVRLNEMNGRLMARPTPPGTAHAEASRISGSGSVQQQSASQRTRRTWWRHGDPARRVGTCQRRASQTFSERRKRSLQRAIQLDSNTFRRRTVVLHALVLSEIITATQHELQLRARAHRPWCRFSSSKRKRACVSESR